jgi:hypothetical protein
VERRKQTRYDVVQAVQVTILDEPPVKLNGRIVNVSGGGFQIHTDGPIRLNSAVRVDLTDAVLLGEVCYCCQESDGLYAIGMESQQILSHTSEFAKLMKSLSGYSDQAPGAPREPERSSSQHAILANE